MITVSGVPRGGYLKKIGKRTLADPSVFYSFKDLLASEGFGTEETKVEPSAWANIRGELGIHMSGGDLNASET